MKKTLENFEGKVVRFKLKPTYELGKPNRHKWSDTGIVKIKKDFIFFQNGVSTRGSLFYIYSGKFCELEWPSFAIDMRTIEEEPLEEQIVWKLEHNM